ncbi:MAG: glycosyltransferase family 39 protein [Pyrinomonadaceae bacterium]
MQPSRLAKRGNILLFLAITGFYFYGLGHLPLVGPDEPRYAEVAREMLVRRDLITPTLGGHLWFEKPVLLYWMMMAAFEFFGVSEWSARLPAAVSGLLTIVAVFWIGRHAERNNPELKNLSFYGSLVSATSIGMVAFSRAASFDIILTVTITWALAFFIVYELRGKPRSFLVGFYVFIGLALLAKGLVGIIIPAGIVGGYYVLRRRIPERTTGLSLLWGMPLALTVAAAWYAPVIWQHGWPFMDRFFIQHHFARYVTSKYHHTQPVFYYLIALPLLCLPWTALLFDGLLKARTWRWRREGARDDAGDKLRVFALAWLSFPLIFFSFSNSKLPGYILPILPAAALIVGEQITRLTSDNRSKTSMIRATAVLWLSCSILGPAYAWRFEHLAGSVAFWIAIPLLLAGTFVLIFAHQRNFAVLIAGTTLVVMITVLHFAAPRRADYESSKRLLELADAKGYSRATIYGMQRQDRTPEFYAAGRIAYGPDGEPIIFEGSTQLIVESLRRNDVILAFVRVEDLTFLSTSHPAQFEVIGENGRFALVAVHPR